MLEAQQQSARVHTPTNDRHVSSNLYFYLVKSRVSLFTCCRQTTGCLLMSSAGFSLRRRIYFASLLCSCVVDGLRHCLTCLRGLLPPFAPKIAPLAYCPAPANYITPDRCFTCTPDTVSALRKSAVSCRLLQQSIVITAISQRHAQGCCVIEASYSIHLLHCLTEK